MQTFKMSWLQECDTINIFLNIVIHFILVMSRGCFSPCLKNSEPITLREIKVWEYLDMPWNVSLHEKAKRKKKQTEYNNSLRRQDILMLSYMSGEPKGHKPLSE